MMDITISDKHEFSSSSSTVASCQFLVSLVRWNEAGRALTTRLTFKLPKAAIFCTTS